MTPAMSTPTPGSRVIAIGFTVILLSVSAGMHVGGIGLLLCFLGVLVGASFVAAGVRMAEADGVPVKVFDGAHALTAFVRRNTAAVGLIIASCVTVVSGETDPVLCFATFALLLLGLTLINIGTRGE